jgi:hypothetical protein
MTGYLPNFRWYGLFLCLVLHGLVSGRKPVESYAPPKRLPARQIESLYKDGDLDSVVIYIRMGRPQTVFLDSNDSLLAFKYLGVIYSADPKTREKGRYYFNELLKLDAKASITDLLPGESARSAFKEVREEYFELHPGVAPPAAPQAPIALDTVPFTVPRKKRSYTWLWVTGGVAAAGTAAAIVLMEPSPKKVKLHD